MRICTYRQRHIKTVVWKAELWLCRWGLGPVDGPRPGPGRHLEKQAFEMTISFSAGAGRRPFCGSRPWTLPTVCLSLLVAPLLGCDRSAAPELAPITPSQTSVEKSAPASAKPSAPKMASQAAPVSEAVTAKNPLAPVGLSSSKKNVGLPDPTMDEPRRVRSAEEQVLHDRMVKLLERECERQLAENMFLGSAPVVELERQLAEFPAGTVSKEAWRTRFQLAAAQLRLGREQSALQHFLECERQVAKLREQLPQDWVEMCLFQLAVNHLRIAETLNCCQRNTPDSCVFPIQGQGVHENQVPSRSAIALLERLLEDSATSVTMRLRASWLINIASMTVGEYPDKVRAEWLIPPRLLESEEQFPRFENIAASLGVGKFNLSGGAIMDDFDGDQDLDIVVSTMYVSEPLVLYRRNDQGGFTPEIAAAGFTGIVGGLNVVHADYDNDGDLDLLVLRGGWFNNKGPHPRSLLQNDGQGFFTDVTFASGLDSAMHPTQTATWLDYDRDGDLDVYIGSEFVDNEPTPSQLYRNDGNSVFTDVAKEAGVTNDRWAKGVCAGDFNRDGWIDIYVSNKGQENRLYQNLGDGTFKDVATELNVTGPIQSFPCWFWDFDNDGSLDIFVGAYDARIDKITATLMGVSQQGEMHKLYRGDGGAFFEDVVESHNLRQPSLPMGSNFGDLDNDGWLDFYLGTGDPDYFNLMPNKMYHNREGYAFSDVTTAGGFGNLQKGHAISFADVDQDGDEDIFAQLGGAYPGDRYYNSLYENPGFNNHWTNIRLVGVRSNKYGVGSHLEMTLETNGFTRTIHRDLNSGGSFGGNSYRLHVGLGEAQRIKTLKITWAGSQHVDEYQDLPVDGLLTCTEGAVAPEASALSRIPFKRRPAPPTSAAFPLPEPDPPMPIPRT